MAGQVLLVAVGALGALFGKEVLKSAADELMKAAAAEVLERMGLALDLDNLSKESITQAIVDGPLGGELQFTNLFDRDAVKADIKRIAIERAGAAFGFGGGLSVDGVKSRLIEEFLNEVTEQVQAGGGAYLDAAKDLSSALRIVAKPPAQVPVLDMSVKAVRNRAYQAKYRASHSKHWEART